MITIPAYSKCPICSRANWDNTWREINHNEIWWERMCSNFNGNCGFAQFYWKSFEDQTLRYIRWNLKNFFCYTYADSSLLLVPGTYFYHKVFPRGESVQNPFQKWQDFMPDWDNLEKLNDKLNVLRNFE
jgi:hypothetical protein